VFALHDDRVATALGAEHQIDTAVRVCPTPSLDVVSLLGVQRLDQLLELLPIDLAEAFRHFSGSWRRKPGWDRSNAGLSIAGPRLFLLAKQLIEQAGTGIEELFDQALAVHRSWGM